MKHIKDLANPNVDRVLIYAGDHGYYWRKGGCGYTTANDAGVFTRAEAHALAGHCGPEKLVELHDVPEDHLPTLKEQIGMIRDYNEALRQERDTLRAHVERLRAGKGEGGVMEERYKFFVWTDHVSYLAVAHARSVEEARQALEDNDLGGLDGSCPERQKARTVIYNENPAVYHGKNAEFCVIGIDGQEQLEAERDALAAQNARLRAALQTIEYELCAISEGKQEEIRNDFTSGEAHGWTAAHEHVGTICTEALSLTPPAALEELRRRERSIGAEEELRRLATVADGNWAADELSDRADQIRDAREKGGAE